MCIYPPTSGIIAYFSTPPRLAHSERLHFKMRLYRTIATMQLLAINLVAASLLETPSTPVINIDSTAETIEALAHLQQHVYSTLEQNEGVSKRTPGSLLLGNFNYSERLVKSPRRRNLHLLMCARAYMGKPDRRAYIEAVQCLRTLPSKSDKS
jgi:tyrosinase